MIAYLSVAFYLDYKTDSKPEIEYSLKALRIAEEKYPKFKSWLYSGLGSAYHDIPDYKAAIKYLSMALALYKADSSTSAGAYSNLYLHFSMSYLGLGQVDSAFYFLQLATPYAFKTNKKQSELLLYIETARVYDALGKEAIAVEYYKRSIDTSVNTKQGFGDAYAFDMYSNFLLKKGFLAEAKTNGLIGLKIAFNCQAKTPFLHIASTLRQTYEGLRRPDSAYYFSKLELAYRDSLFNSQKLSDLQNITFAEQIRQGEEAIKESKTAQEQKDNLQYAGIALGLVIFVIAFLLFSHTVIANQGVIRFLGVLSLLVLFEFINLLLHPYVGDLTHHSPVLMLLFMVCLAALLIPLHHKLEHWITHKMVDKNKHIRLEAAKKTIAHFERNS
jgi:tetratricopeptide (TPR) repeat protein